jgi:long-chain acyl-CoA synthetase
MNVTRTFDLLDRYQDNFPKEIAFAFKKNKEWISYSSDEYISFAYFFCYGLMELGFRKGDKIATVSSNRPEWNFIDIGMSMAGIVHVPMYTSLKTSEYESILKAFGFETLVCFGCKSAQEVKTGSRTNGSY